MTQPDQPIDGSYGQINGIDITEDVIARLVKDAEAGFPNATFRSPGRPPRTSSSTRAITVRLGESELTALMQRAEREHLSRSEAIRTALAEWASA